MKTSNCLVKVFGRYKSDCKAEHDAPESEQGSFRMAMAEKMERQTATRAKTTLFSSSCSLR